MNYILDPMLFAFDVEATKEELESYLMEMQVLGDWWNDHRDEMYVLSDMAYELGDFYPCDELLRPLLKKYNIEWYSLHDLRRVMIRYLEKSKCIDTLCEKLIIDKQEMQIVEREGITDGDLEEGLSDSLMKLIWFMFCLKMIHNDKDDAYVVLSKGVTEKMKVDFRYETIETSNGNSRVVANDGSMNLTCYGSLTDFLRKPDTPSRLWRMAENREDLELGLRVAIYQHHEIDELKEALDNYKFVVQASFWDNYVKNKYADRQKDIESTIKSMTNVVLEIYEGNEHNWRTGKKGSNPYMYHKDNNGVEYAAMRKNVTTSIKLHYWKKSPWFRFANIGEHDFEDFVWEDISNF